MWIKTTTVLNIKIISTSLLEKVKNVGLYGDYRTVQKDGQLIVACREKEDAVQQLTAWLQENPEAAERYSVEDLELRYMASVVPVDALSEADGIPKIYIMSFAPTATIAYGKYAMNVFRGAYKKIGIPARTGLTSVVTRLSTEEQRSRTDASVSWLAIKFEAMGVFNPEDYTTK